MTERITPTAIAAELDLLDGEAKRVAGDVVVTIGFTNAMVKDLAPNQWEEVAAYLHALLEREPLKSSPAFGAHRLVLGALATELRGFAKAAGEPVGLEVDLRSAGSKAEERRIRERMHIDAEDFTRHIDRVIDTHHVQQAVTSPQEEPEPTDAAQVDEPSDDDWV